MRHFGSILFVPFCLNRGKPFFTKDCLLSQICGKSSRSFRLQRRKNRRPGSCGSGFTEHSIPGRVISGCFCAIKSAFPAMICGGHDLNAGQSDRPCPTQSAGKPCHLQAAPLCISSRRRLFFQLPACGGGENRDLSVRAGEESRSEWSGELLGRLSEPSLPWCDLNAGGILTEQKSAIQAVASHTHHKKRFLKCVWA